MNFGEREKKEKERETNKKRDACMNSALFTNAL
jgi:hypothetical protein